MEEQDKMETKEDLKTVAVEFIARRHDSSGIALTMPKDKSYYTVAVKRGTTWDKFLEDSGIEGRDRRVVCNMITFKYYTKEGLWPDIYNSMYIPRDWQIRNIIDGGVYIMSLITENPDEDLRKVDGILRRYEAKKFF